MNYYEHHLGDYLRDAAYLSLTEEGAYRRLIDAYYVREKPLPSDRQQIYKLIRVQSRTDRRSVDYILDTFFKITEDGYWHKRCNEEIQRYKSKSEKAAASANARWSKTERTASGMRTHSEGNALQTPVTSNQYPDTTHHTPDSRARTGVRARVGVNGKPVFIPPRSVEELEREEAEREARERIAQVVPLPGANDARR